MLQRNLDHKGIPLPTKRRGRDETVDKGFRLRHAKK
jgi:hypothetical protein